jgi:hypothetical protein
VADSPAGAAVVAAAAAGRAGAALFLTWSAVCGLARADDIERITDYRSDVTVARDGTLDVTETITVNARGDAIIHGIFRDFPTIYRQSGNTHVRFDVEGAQMDGHAVPYELGDLDNGRRVQMGDADTTLHPGPHTFVLHYATDRQIAFGAKADRLAWNATGTGWDFAIDHVHATLRLPAGAMIAKASVYTGAQGVRGGDATPRKLSANAMAFDTTRMLDPNEGLTFDVTFAKGAVTPPTDRDRARYFLRDNKGAAGALAGLVLLFLYFGAVWFIVGRDPKRGVIVPLFVPPSGLSPAAMRFVQRMHYDRKAFAATLIGLAVKGVATIAETPHLMGPVYTLHRAGEARESLSQAETGVADALLGFDDEVELSQKSHGQIAAAIATLKKDLSAEYERVYFNQNHAWFWPGLGIIALSCVAAALLSDDLGGALLVFLWSGLFGIAAAVFTTMAFGAWRQVWVGAGSRAIRMGLALMRTLAALPFVATLIGITFFLNAAIQPVTVAILVTEAIVAVLFYDLLRAPTLAGAKLRDQIEGFALYLKTAEGSRIAAQITPDLFERYLPYAVALDCENAWSARFEAATAQAGTGSEGGTTPLYNPMWYQGASFSTLGAANFVSSIGASIGNAAASAAVAPGSGGGGGGSFSGGGGGGGGGGGW